MSEVLNSVIKFDLHIHSKASEYKESAGIVELSTKENIGILLSQLNQHEVSLFSITDHNRFDPDLYLEINKILANDGHPFPNVKAALPGIEFDVVIDEEMNKCHIIAIFDTKNDPDKLQAIVTGLETNLLKEVDKAYSSDEFQTVLTKIGLNTILIASQKKDINDHSGNHTSLSDSTMNVEEVVRVGYINALEFQKPKVEGILRNNLIELSLPAPLVSGSDCHDWTCYPNHSRQDQKTEFHHSRAKILPTFKGLLMAVTSPETRFNCSQNYNTSVVNSLVVKKQDIPLVNGINAIIGENGSGKSTLLKVITEKISEPHVQKLISANDLEADISLDPNKIKYIEQGHIINRFNDGNLFSGGDGRNFKELDTAPFRKVYSEYSSALMDSIEALIKKEEVKSSLSKSITFKDGMKARYYFIHITCNEDLERENNPHEKARGDINELLEKAKSLLDDSYFEPFKHQLEQVVERLTVVRDDIEVKWNSVDHEMKVKNIMYGSIKDYERKLDLRITTRDKDVNEYNNQKNQLVNTVVAAIKDSIQDVEWPDEPDIMEGITRNPKQGFYFNREAAYNETSMVKNFFEKMFVQNYNSIQKLQRINSYEQFADALRYCTRITDINQKWMANFDKFIEEAIKTNEYILDGAEQQIGNTLGEMSLSYYKYYTQDPDWNVLIIDQPEDNISNRNISQSLLTYFNDIRHEKQIIFVTHNPLLVVNLDVDNVIFVKNSNNALSFCSGCLEYEDVHTNILALVAEHMDGGKETVEKRLKVYGKNN